MASIYQQAATTKKLKVKKRNYSGKIWNSAVAIGSKVIIHRTKHLLEYGIKYIFV